ncbi:MAG TPA: ABC transporter substrate-binding protein [Pseudonocardiaceae bacterium]|jgi:osmoprotectant transport system substrate-binding protein|nr:ABC transporter substrate-binding protein [Pseudonocardiaceae bacterium]
MKRTVAGLTAAVMAVLSLTACGGSSDPLKNNSGSGQSASDTIVVGSGNFPESRLLAEIYAEALSAKGVKVEKKLNIGNRELYYKGLQDGSIDLIPEYTGVLLQYINKDTPETAPDDVYAALKKALPSSLTVLDKAAAEDKDAVVVTQATVQKYNLKSIADLAAHCKDLVLGGPAEFRQRADGVPGLEKKYGCTFKEFKSLDVGGPLTVAALKDGSIDAADLFTTDSSVKDNNFVVLEDPKNNFAAQNVVPLINAKKAGDNIKKVLNSISAKLSTETLLELNAKLGAPDKPEADKVAKDWLAQNNI